MQSKKKQRQNLRGENSTMIFSFVSHVYFSSLQCVRWKSIGRSGVSNKGKEVANNFRQWIRAEGKPVKRKLAGLRNENDEFSPAYLQNVLQDVNQNMPTYDY